MSDNTIRMPNGRYVEFSVLVKLLRYLHRKHESAAQQGLVDLGLAKDKPQAKYLLHTLYKIDENDFNISVFEEDLQMMELFEYLKGGC